MTVKDILAEPLIVNEIAQGKELEDRVGEVLERVGLQANYMRRYPHAFSGGQRQRIAIARAIILRPEFIVCDEAVSALDVSVQAQILNLLKDLQKEFNLTYLFIAHDLSVIKHICDEVAVMYVGKIVETALTEELFNQPKHPYTEALLSAVPKTDPNLKSNRILLKGEIPDPSKPPSGCYFHPRCRYSKEICINKQPKLLNINGSENKEHFTACHFFDSLDLRGIHVMSS
jgi:peptide/nickel transport system ATP-binding protein